MTLTKPLDHDNAAVVMFRAEVMDMNASPEFPNQTDIGELQDVTDFLMWS